MIKRKVSESRETTRALFVAEKGMIIKGTWSSEPNVVCYFMCVLQYDGRRCWFNLSDGNLMQNPVSWDDPVRLPEIFEYIGTVRGSVTLHDEEQA